MPPHPDYLVIGHITKDIYDGGYKIGGTVTFSALTALNLGHRPAIVTSYASDVDLSGLPSGISISARSSTSSTTFENVYQDGHRRQFTRSQAHLLTHADIPRDWHNVPIVHLGPIAQEVDQNIAAFFPNVLLGLTPQGWMREWDAQGRVYPTRWDPPARLLERADAVILSEEDVGGELDQIQSYANRTRLLVLTGGWRGSTVYWRGQVRSFPAPQVQETDPTGAGDIYATAFLSALHSTGDAWVSAQFANCVAAHSVERTGLSSIPAAREIECCRSIDRVLSRSSDRD